MRLWEIRQEKSENDFERAMSNLDAKICTISGTGSWIRHLGGRDTVIPRAAARMSATKRTLGIWGSAVE
jgi:hypothetical protein